MIPRLLEMMVLRSLEKYQKLILIYGPRQAGKTTLLQSIKAKKEQNGLAVLYLNCDLEEDRKVINTTALTPLTNLLTKTDLLLVDEAQRLDDPGLTLKIIHDNLPKVKVIATGSSSFRLKNIVSDALTGRFLDYTLYPLSFWEIISYLKFSENKELKRQQANQTLPAIILYGLYPEVFLARIPVDKQLFLTKIVDSYLFKDILTFQKIRHSEAIVNLARALSYQIGSEINENELANRLKIDRKTVVNYLNLLEQSFVIIKVHPFSKNLRREIGRNYKVYFLDLGLRNALIGNFQPLDIRPDIGALWENFIIMERLKNVANRGETFRYHFWRTFGGAEVDWIEKSIDQTMRAFECKYKKTSLSRGSRSFTKRYKTAVELININNYLDFL